MPFHDVFILLDNSGSLGSVNFEAQKQTAISLVNDYGGQANNPMRFSVIQFATNASIVHSLNDPQAVGDVVQSLNDLNYTGGFTRTDDALALMLDEWDQYFGGAGTSSAIIFTDGQPYSSSGPVEICNFENQIKSRAIGTHVVGHGGGWVSQNGADKMACLVEDPSLDILSKPSPLVYDMNDYSYLSATTMVAMPEPGTLAVLGLGIAIIGFARRRTA